MNRLLFQKFLLGLLYLFFISAAAFFIVRQMPGDPAVLCSG